MTEENIFNEMLSRLCVCYRRGSFLYGTYVEGISDDDYIVVVGDIYKDFLSQYPRGIFQGTETETVKLIEPDCFGYNEDRIINRDYEFVCESDFIKMIEDNDIVALEAIFLPENLAYGAATLYREYFNHFKLDKWKLRENVSHICSNSWVKCKKKLTVEKDYNLRIAQKSLFHSLRIYMFGIQIAEQGKIVDYQCAKDLWKEIENAENPTWEYYKEKYQPMFNSLRSRLVELCPKPEEKFKDKKVANVDEK